MDLIAFLTARLDEDELAANEVHLPRTCGSVDRDGDFDPDPVWCGCHYPARVLLEVEAKRAILALHDGTHDCPIATLVGDPKWLYVSSEHVAEGALPPYWPCTTMRQLAAVYSDHPDYRQEWKP